MALEISNNKTYQDYIDLNLYKSGCKSATFENVSAILKLNNVEVNPKPTSLVSFYFWKLGKTGSDRAMCYK